MLSLLFATALLLQDAEPSDPAAAPPSPEAEDEFDPDALREMMDEIFELGLQMQDELGMDAPDGQMSREQYQAYMDELFAIGAEEEERARAGLPPRSEEEIEAEVQRRLAARQNTAGEPESVLTLDPLQPAVEFQTPQERLEERLTALAAADTQREAAPLVDEILALWAHSGSDTISLLMDRGLAAEMAGDAYIAGRMYDHVNRLAPDFAEGWLASGRIAADIEDWGYALETLNTALTLEPRRFDAYFTLGRTLERAEAPEAALEAYNEALAIYPAFEPALQAKERLEAALAGRPL